MCSLPVEVSMCFWAAFLLSVILRWFPQPPRVWSLAASFSCSASLKLACLEPGVSPGVGVCTWAPMCTLVCLPTQELSPPCLASEWWDRNVPLLAPARPLWVTALIIFAVLLGHFFPCEWGLVAFGRLPWWRRTLDYGKCFNHLCHYLCLLAQMIKSCYWWL